MGQFIGMPMSEYLRVSARVFLCQRHSTELSSVRVFGLSVSEFGDYNVTVVGCQCQTNGMSVLHYLRVGVRVLECQCQ